MFGNVNWYFATAKDLKPSFFIFIVGENNTGLRLLHSNVCVYIYIYIYIYITWNVNELYITF